MPGEYREADRFMQELLMFIPNLTKMLYRLVKEPKIAASEKALFLSALAYVISPLDFLPDIIPFLGQIDDLLLVSLVLKRFMNTAGEDLLLQYWDGKQKLLVFFNNVLDLSSRFIPADIYNKIVKKAAIDAEYDVR